MISSPDAACISNRESTHKTLILSPGSTSKVALSCSLLDSAPLAGLVLPCHSHLFYTFPVRCPILTSHCRLQCCQATSRSTWLRQSQCHIWSTSPSSTASLVRRPYFWQAGLLTKDAARGRFCPPVGSVLADVAIAAVLIRASDGNVPGTDLWPRVADSQSEHVNLRFTRLVKPLRLVRLVKVNSLNPNPHSSPSLTPSPHACTS